MSTFDGIIAEIPEIRVDYFRRIEGHPAPLACFLSHVHSDHLAGLESLKSPFIWCSAATKEMLIRLERYPCRINYAKNIIEARTQTYKHLKNILKPLPLDTPTMIDLRPNHDIRVTLFDANHCPGAVMFLFEKGPTAVLYTGDMRSEPWFVNTIARNPAFIEYTSGIRTLDKIYLDTSFLRDIPFQTKVQGIAELIRKVSAYPKETIFHFSAWTFGYEDVWIALSKALDSKIHVDEYKWKLYQSLSVRVPEKPPLLLCSEAAALAGFKRANTDHKGCLTEDINVRIHSCEKGNHCSVVKNSPVVWIKPVVAHRPDGTDIIEVGVGGGGDDLEQEVELEGLTPDHMDQFIAKIEALEDMTPETRELVRDILRSKTADGRNVPLDLSVLDLGQNYEASMMAVVDSLTRMVRPHEEAMPQQPVQSSGLSREIYFPYSRHSSYAEQSYFVETFRPRDVWPCTVHPEEWLKNGTSIRSLFGKHCSGDVFQHDVKMEEFRPLDSQSSHNMESLCTESQHTESQNTASKVRERTPTAPGLGTTHRPIVLSDSEGGNTASQQSLAEPPAREEEEVEAPRKRSFDAYAQGESQSSVGLDGEEEEELDDPHRSPPRKVSSARIEAYHAMMRNVSGRTTEGWEVIDLLSTRDAHSASERELGDG